MAWETKKENLSGQMLPGREIWKAVGKDGPMVSTKMTIGFADYSEAAGPMEPHHHAEETVFIVEAEKGSYRCGPSPESLGESRPLKAGMLIHFDELEWHVFEYESGGYVRIIFIYGQVERIRPEEIE